MNIIKKIYLRIKSGSDFVLTRFDNSSGEDYLDKGLNIKSKDSIPTLYVVIIVLLVVILAIYFVTKF